MARNLTELFPDESPPPWRVPPSWYCRSALSNGTAITFLSGSMG